MLIAYYIERAYRKVKYCIFPKKKPKRDFIY